MAQAALVLTHKVICAMRILLSRAETNAMTIPPLREERDNEASQDCDTKIMFTICAQLVAVVRKPELINTGIVSQWKRNHA